MSHNIEDGFALLETFVFVVTGNCESLTSGLGTSTAVHEDFSNLVLLYCTKLGWSGFDLATGTLLLASGMATADCTFRSIS